MSGHHCAHDTPAPQAIIDLPRYRRILWIALVINAAMFLTEICAGYQSGSLSLLADAIDFAGDAVNYAVSLAVLSAALAWRARAAMAKALAMVMFGLFVLGQAVWRLWIGSVPDASTMGTIGVLALVANVSVAWMLYAFREGDANMRSVWLCSRNDAFGNLAVMGAALGVFGTGQAWPDLAVAAIMASLALHSGTSVMRQSLEEIGHDKKRQSDHSGHSHD
jgi:cation diffusion facilitator family transporter